MDRQNIDKITELVLFRFSIYFKNKSRVLEAKLCKTFG